MLSFMPRRIGSYARGECRNIFVYDKGWQSTRQGARYR
jgi:hypothetical protein